MAKGVYLRLIMIKDIDLSRHSLKKFGRTMCICLFLIGTILFLKHKALFKIWWFIGFLFLFLVQFSPLTLRPAYKLWMSLAFYLGWINTRIILFIVYYLIVTPIAITMKMFGKDVLNIRLEKQAGTYWMKKENITMSKERYERLF